MPPRRIDALRLNFGGNISYNVHQFQEPKYLTSAINYGEQESRLSKFMALTYNAILTAICQVQFMVLD